MAYNDNSINRDVILNYALSTYGTEPEYPWESSPDNAVLRNMMSGKWYAIIMCVKRQILGLDGDGFVDVMNVKCDPILVGSLRMKNGFLPAYHMNKDKWISILLDGSVSKEEIFPLIDESYNLLCQRLKNAQKSDIIIKSENRFYNRFSDFLLFGH